MMENDLFSDSENLISRVDTNSVNSQTSLPETNSSYVTTRPDSVVIIQPPDLPSDELALYIQSVIQDELEPKQKNNNYSYPILFVRVLLTLFGLLSGYPYFAIAKKAGRGNERLGFVFAIATLISSGGSTSWVVNEVVDKHIPLKDFQKRIFNTKAHRLRIIISDILSLFGGLPFAYAAYKFNSKNVGLGVMAYLVAYFYGSIGFYQLLCEDSAFMKLIGRCLFSQEKIQCQKDKVHMISLVQYLTSDYQEHPRKFNTFYTNISAAANRQEQYLLFIEEIKRVNHQRNQSILPEQWLKGYPRTLFVTFFCLFPLVNSVTEFTLAWDNAISLINNPIFATFLMIVSALPDLVLNLYSGKLLSQGVFDRIYYSKKIFKHTSFGNTIFLVSLSIISFCVSCLASNANAYITQNTLEEKGFRKWAKLFAVATWATNVIFQTFALNDLGQKTVSYFKGRNSSAQHLRNNLSGLVGVISNSKKETYKSFTQLPELSIFDNKNDNEDDSMPLLVRPVSLNDVQ